MRVDRLWCASSWFRIRKLQRGRLRAALVSTADGHFQIVAAIAARKAAQEERMRRSRSPMRSVGRSFSPVAPRAAAAAPYYRRRRHIPPLAAYVPPPPAYVPPPASPVYYDPYYYPLPLGGVDPLLYAIPAVPFPERCIEEARAECAALDTEEKRDVCALAVADLASGSVSSHLLSQPSYALAWKAAQSCL